MSFQIPSLSRIHKDLFCGKIVGQIMDSGLILSLIIFLLTTMTTSDLLPLPSPELSDLYTEWTTLPPLSHGQIKADARSSPYPPPTTNPCSTLLCLSHLVQ